MFRIEKVIVNGAGNALRSAVVGFVNCGTGELLDNLVKTYSALAKSDSLYYKLRGQDTTVEYVFTKIEVAEVSALVDRAKLAIVNNVQSANKHIDFVNKAVSVSNKKRLKPNDNLIKHIDVGDYMFGVQPDVMIAEDKIVVK